MEVGSLIQEFEKKLILQQYRANAFLNCKSVVMSFLRHVEKKFYHRNVGQYHWNRWPTIDRNIHFISIGSSLFAISHPFF